MTDAVPCPECPRTATVVGRFWVDAAGGPAEVLRLRCDGLLTFLAMAAEVRVPASRPAPRRHLAPAA